MTTATSCDVCHDERAVVVVADSQGSERQLCAGCWARIEAKMPGVRALHFAGQPGRRITR